MSCKKEKTREFILDKTYALFAEKGFRSITMKDICVVTGLSRGGLYSHFSSTREVFEAILQKLNQKEELDFYKEMEQGKAAVSILHRAFELMEEEMKHPEDSLSLAMYEYAEVTKDEILQSYNETGEEKWKALITYGIAKGEFNKVDVEGIVNIILYVYQGVRMWSRIVKIPPETMESIIQFIKETLIREEI